MPKVVISVAGGLLMLFLATQHDMVTAAVIFSGAPSTHILPSRQLIQQVDATSYPPPLGSTYEAEVLPANEKEPEQPPAKRLHQRHPADAQERYLRARASSIVTTGLRRATTHSSPSRPIYHLIERIRL